VRNIMPTDGAGASQTDAADVLKGIHQSALRKRANSLRERGGALRLGMSGSPGLIDTSAKNRLNAQVRNLFVGAQDLVGAAGEGGLTARGQPTRKGRSDFDTGRVMKNDGTDLGSKKTFYLTFVRGRDPWAKAS
jgi:hypothetical protein